MIAIPNMDKPKECVECFYGLRCKVVPRWLTADFTISSDCPLIEIVTCGECKWWNRDYKTESKGLCERNICGFTEPTDFCSCGERRNE